MGKHRVVTTWAGELAFDSAIGPYTVRIEKQPDTGAVVSGPGPKSLLLTALTGCTAIDVAMLLPKMRVPFSALSIEAEADLTDEHPKVYKEIRLVYRVACPPEREEKVRQAIALSLDKYCGVAAMLRAHCPINWALTIDP